MRIIKTIQPELVSLKVRFKKELKRHDTFGLGFLDKVLEHVPGISPDQFVALVDMMYEPLVNYATDPSKAAGKNTNKAKVILCGETLFAISRFGYCLFGFCLNSAKFWLMQLF